MKKFLFALIFLLVLILPPFLILKFVRIGDVSCESQFGSCDKSLVEQLKTAKGKNISDARGYLNDILKKNPIVLNFSIKFQLLSNFKVDVIERKAIAAFVGKDSNLILIDEDGVVIGKTETTNLPKITTSIELAKDELVYVANLVSNLYVFYNTNKVMIDANGLTVENIAGKKVIFPLFGDKDVLMGSLGLILSRLPSVKEISTIDLRFKNPVLR